MDRVTFLHIPKTGGVTVHKVCTGQPGYLKMDHSQGEAFYQRHIAGKQEKFGFIFTFVRNPFDRVVSAFFYDRIHNRYNSDFRAFVLDDGEKGLAAQVRNDVVIFRPQAIWLEGIVLNFVGRIENINNDLSEICERVGWDLPEEIPRENKSKHEHFTEYYDDEVMRRVGSLYYRDFELLCYDKGIRLARDEG